MDSAPTQTIEIVVNGEARLVPEGLDVARLLAHLAINPERVAVELNRAIVRQQDWSSTKVLPNSQLEIVWFVGGGCQ